MENFNGFPTPTNVEAPLGTDDNGPEAKRDWPNSYGFIIGMMFYLALNTRSEIDFSFNKCAWFTYNSKASHKTSVKRICRYIQGTKDKVPVFNPSKKLVVYCYVYTNFTGLLGNENTQYPICDRSRTGFVVSFSNCPL